MRRIILFILVVMFSSQVTSQELNCTVTVNSSKIESADTDLFKTLEQAITEYMNDTTRASFNSAVITDKFSASNGIIYLSPTILTHFNQIFNLFIDLVRISILTRKRLLSKIKTTRQFTD